MCTLFAKSCQKISNHLHAEPCHEKSAFCICENGTAVTSKIRNFKPIAIFCGGTVWFVLYSFGNHNDRFSNDAAHACLSGI